MWRESYGELQALESTPGPALAAIAPLPDAYPPSI